MPGNREEKQEQPHLAVRGAVVTGVTGVVGSALAAELVRRGIRVLALVRPDSPNRNHLPKDPLLTTADCPLEALGSFVPPEEGGWDAFFHLGWAGTKGPSREDPDIHTENIRYALDAVRLARRLGCRVFVGAGSQAEYGRVSAPLEPDTPERPESAYGIGKLAAGRMTRLQCRREGIRHVWTRILSVYGPGDGPRTLVTSLITSLLEGEKPLTTAGGQIWDLLYSGDAARALLAAAERGADGKTYLIASGEARTLRSQIETIRDAVSPGAAVGFGEIPYSPRQVMYLAADIRETERDLGWRPEVSLAEGARRTAEQIRRQAEAKRIQQEEV